MPWRPRQGCVSLRPDRSAAAGQAQVQPGEELPGRANIDRMMDVQVIKQVDLPWSNIAHELVGADHGGAGVCIIFVDAPPGRGPSPHTHPYEEILIVTEGEGTFEISGDEIVAGAGEIIIVPPDTPHAFKNTGDGPLRQIDIHVSPTFSTTWLT
jgi:quercetin dioxygenase-like cupin family protein